MYSLCESWGMGIRSKFKAVRFNYIVSLKVVTTWSGDKMSTSLRKEVKDYKVSSVLNNDRKMFGKKYLFDANEETCWNSDKGVPQWIEFSFSMVKTIQQLKITFQGGFAPKSCVLEGVCEDDCDTDSIGTCTPKFEFYPKDSNEEQIFQLESLLSSKKFKLTFLSSYDFYGRIIIYDLNMMGN